MAPEPAEVPGLTSGPVFPGAVRLELDERLDEVIGRVGELRAVQGRLSGLFAATRYVAERLELGELAQRLVESARTLVGARYAALAITRDGRVHTFVDSGMSGEEPATTERFPIGREPPGDLVAGSRSPRLQDRPEDPAPVGIPGEGARPPLRSVLRAPLRTSVTDHGHLHLAGKQDGDEFSGDDAELLTAFAVAAGMAVENALLLESDRRLAHWQSAAAEVGRKLLGGTLETADGLRHLLEEVMGIAGAQGAAATSLVTDVPDRIDVPCATGALAALDGHVVPAAGSVTRAALAARGPIVIGDPADAADPDERLTVMRDLAPQIGSVLAIPLADGVTGDGTQAVLLLVRDHGHSPFGTVDAELAEGLATQVSATLALARGHADREAVRRVEDRERLIADLDTQILQRLLRVGWALAAAAAAADGGADGRARDGARARLLDQIDVIDRLVHELRRTVWTEVDPA